MVAVLLVVAAACGDTTATVATTVPAATTTTAVPTTPPVATTATPPTTLPPDLPVAAEPPWTAIPLAVTDVPELLAVQWEESGVKGFCSALYPGAPLAEDAAIRSADFGDGWAVAWDLPDGPGRLPSGEYCEDCGRGAFGVAGATGPASGDETEVWAQQLAWSDGSKAGYGFEGLGDGSQGEPLLMYLLVTDEGCLYNVWSFLGDEHLLGLVGSLRFVDGLRGVPTPWTSESTPAEVVEAGEAPWVTEPPVEAGAISNLYIVEWEDEAGSPASCPLLAYADLGADAADATIRRANSEGEMLLAWDRPSGPGHDAGSEPCTDCGRGAVGLGTFLGGEIGDRPVTRRWSDGSQAATFAGFYGTEGLLQPEGFDCVYWMWSHLGEDHLDYLFTQLRRVTGYP
jgi:hypothetical protein